MQSRREVNLILRTAKFVTDLNYIWLHFERKMKKSNNEQLETRKIFYITIQCRIQDFFGRAAVST